MTDKQRSRSEETSSDEEKNLWKELKVDFKLEASRFPDDKIYGRIQIVPELSRRLIKKFRLFVDKTSIADLDPQITHVSASGFHSNKHGYRSAHIEALPRSKYKDMQEKLSASRQFFFNGHSFYANPTITFEPSIHARLSNTVAVIKWYHLGDNKARRYLLYLDGKQIQQVSGFTDDKLVVGIHDLKEGTKHEFQLVAMMGRKKSYRSDPLAFTVPKAGKYDDEIINVREDRMPPTFPAMSRPDDDEDEDDGQEGVDPAPETKLRCCSRAPHDTFPGIDHYLQPIPDPPTSNKK